MIGLWTLAIDKLMRNFQQTDAIFTHADGSRVSIQGQPCVTVIHTWAPWVEVSRKALYKYALLFYLYLYSDLWFCTWFFCPRDKTKTAETKIAKLGTEILHHDISPIRSKGQRSGSKSHDETAVRRRVAQMWRRSTRRRRTAGVSYAFYRVPSL